MNYEELFFKYRVWETWIALGIAGICLIIFLFSLLSIIYKILKIRLKKGKEK